MFIKIKSELKFDFLNLSGFLFDVGAYESLILLFYCRCICFQNFYLVDVL